MLISQIVSDGAEAVSMDHSYFLWKLNDENIFLSAIKNYTNMWG